MLYSTTTQYAIRGLSELAARAGQESMMLEQIVGETGLPLQFMSKVFQQLVKAGILTSAKGRGGGFALARPIHDITLLQIIEAIDGASACDACVLGMPACNDAVACAQHDLFKPIRQRLKDYWKTTTLADLSASLKCKWP